MNAKTIKIFFSMYVIGVVALLQMVAWTLEFDGTVFAFTSLLIGAIAGSILGFSFNARGGAKSKK